MRKLLHPVFLSTFILLVLNDWCLKPAFHNDLTGKLSDIAGLFAFPFLLSTLLPRHVRAVHVMTAALFIFWKSEYSQPAIDYINMFNLPVHRTIDASDNIALCMIPLSYSFLMGPVFSHPSPVLQKLILACSCLAFMATTMPPRTQRKFVDINKMYTFNFSKHELVSRINRVQIREVRKLMNQAVQVDFDSGSNAFHVHGQNDTLALLLDYEKIKDQDTIHLRTSFAELQISGDESESALRLFSVYKMVNPFKEKDYKDIAVHEFEKRFIRQIRHKH